MKGFLTPEQRSELLHELTVEDKAKYSDRIKTILLLDDGDYLMKVNLRTPTQKLYWHLISKGYKTYLLLTKNFDNYYPRHDAPTPPLAQKLMDSFAEQMYPENFKRDLGLLVFQEPHEKLKSDVAPITVN